MDHGLDKRCSLDCHIGPSRLSWSTDGRFVASWYDDQTRPRTVKVFDCKTGKLLWIQTSWQVISRMGRVIWSPSGASMIVFNDGAVHVFDFGPTSDELDELSIA